MSDDRALKALEKLSPEHRSIIQRLVFDKPRDLCHHEQEALDEFYVVMRNAIRSPDGRGE